MVYKTFRSGLVIRLILFTLCIFFFLIAMKQMEWYLTSVVSAILIAFFAIEIIKYSDRTNKVLANYLLALRQNELHVLQDK